LTRCEIFHTICAKVRDIVPRVLTVLFVMLQDSAPRTLERWRWLGFASPADRLRTPSRPLAV